MCEVSRTALPAWLLPAVIAGAATVVIVLVVGLFVDNDPARPAGLPRHRIASIEPFPTSPAPSSSTAAPVDFALVSNGLVAVHFGQPAEHVIAKLTRKYGTPDEDSPQPCDGGKQARWVRWAGLSAVFSATTAKFIGYIDGVNYPPGRPPLDLGTLAGLVPGNSVERVHTLYDPVEIRKQPAQPGRPATELFTIPDPQTTKPLTGVLEDRGGETVVSTIFAGKLC